MANVMARARVKVRARGMVWVTVMIAFIYFGGPSESQAGAYNAG